MRDNTYKLKGILLVLALIFFIALSASFINDKYAGALDNVGLFVIIGAAMFWALSFGAYKFMRWSQSKADETQPREKEIELSRNVTESAALYGGLLILYWLYFVILPPFIHPYFAAVKFSTLFILMSLVWPLVIAIPYSFVQHLWGETPGAKKGLVYTTVLLLIFNFAYILTQPTPLYTMKGETSIWYNPQDYESYRIENPEKTGTLDPRDASQLEQLTANTPRSIKEKIREQEEFTPVKDMVEFTKKTWRFLFGSSGNGSGGQLSASRRGRLWYRSEYRPLVQGQSTGCIKQILRGDWVEIEAIEGTLSFHGQTIPEGGMRTVQNAPANMDTSVTALSKAQVVYRIFRK